VLSLAISFSLVLMLLSACSFDYSSMSGSENEKADIIMEEIEYVRVRGGDPLVRFRAEYAERWEERQIMNLTNFSFEQMEDKGDNIDAEGTAGSAVVKLESGNIALSDGIKINVASEDVSIETASLDWYDDDKVLSGREEALVIIQRSDGTYFTGRGFSADARNRSWAFSGEVKGTYVEEDDDEDGEKENKEFQPTRVEWSRTAGEQDSWESIPKEHAPETARSTPSEDQKPADAPPAAPPITPDEEK